MRRILEISILSLLALIAVVPAIQRTFRLVDSKPLKGWHAPSYYPNITSNTWFSGEYQDAFDDYAADSFGFTNQLVRFHNQLDFDLFKTPNARYVVIGKDNYLYETAYIETVMGMDFPGDSVVKEKCSQLKEIEQWMGNTQLLVVLAPGKGSYFPEFIPEYYKKYQSDSTLYNRYKYHLGEQEINYLDFHQWFRSMKDTSSYALYPKTGIHWSSYGQVLAADSLQRYLSRWFNRKLPHYSWTFGEPSTIPQGSDADVEEGMNLSRSLEHFEMVYPNVTIDTAGSNPLKTCVIADSYFWGLFDKGFSSRASRSGEFWYYFNDIYPDYFETGKTINEVDIKTELKKFDVVILLATDATLDRFAWGFTERLTEEIQNRD